jgi:putative intracellular protease/amidase
MQIAILSIQVSPRSTRWGPWEVLSRMPDAEVRFFGKEPEPVVTEGGALLMGITHAIADTPDPDVVVVPGGSTTSGQMVDEGALDWLRKVHGTALPTSNGTASGGRLMPGGVRLRPRDMAKIGQLVTTGGRWNGRQIISKDWIEASTTQKIKATDGQILWISLVAWPLLHNSRQVDWIGALGRDGQSIRHCPGA